MKRSIKKIIITGIIFVFLCSPITASAADSYTYTYDYWGEVQESPDAYRVTNVLTYKDLGLDKALSNPQGLFVKDNLIYICDTGNNRIIEFERINTKYQVNRVIDSFVGDTEVLTFASPSDIYVTEEGDMFIADTDNNRVVKLDKDLNFLLDFTKPADATFDQSLSFFPVKVVADVTGRAFVLGKNINKGLIKYENDGTFTGFIGANKVTYSVTDYIWKKLSTQAQRAQQESFVPTEYDNIYMDLDGFIYAVTTTFSGDDLIDDKAKPIRKLNVMGADILVKNGTYPPIGDLDWGEAGGYSGSSKFIDISVLDNEVYFGLDKTRGRIFGYDDQGNLLYTFGGAGNMEGYFRSPSAIENMGTDLLVLDSKDGSITVFETTEFGEYIFKALEEYKKGNYSESSSYWTEVLRLNGNYKLAYAGIGRSLLREGEYKKAMDYFKINMDDTNYSKAFKLYRKEIIEENILYIFIGVFLILIVPLGIGKYKKMKVEVELFEKSRKF